MVPADSGPYPVVRGSGALRGMNRAARTLCGIVAGCVVLSAGLSWFAELRTQRQQIAAVADAAAQGLDAYLSQQKQAIEELGGKLIDAGGRIADQPQARAALTRFVRTRPDVADAYLSYGGQILAGADPHAVRGGVAPPRTGPAASELRDRSRISVSAGEQTAGEAQIVWLHAVIAGGGEKPSYVLTVSLREQALRRVWSAVRPPEGSALWLRRDDGIPGAHGHDADTGGNVEGGFGGASAYRHLSGLPLVVVAAVPLSHILRLWWEGSRLHILLLGIFFTAGIASYRGMRRNLYAWERNLSASRDVLQASRRRYEGIIEAAMDAIVTADSGQTIVQFNKAAEQMFGYRAQDIIGQPLERLLPPRHRAVHAGLVRAFGGGGSTSRRMGALREVAAERANGEEFPVEVSISHLKIGAVSLYSAILRDVSERRSMEQGLRQAVEESERSNRAKTEFLSSMSHELRTPLNAVLGYGQLLDVDTQHPLSPDQRAFVGHILQAGKHLLGLVEDVLDLSRIESGRVELVLEPVAVVDLLRECVQMTAPAAEKRCIRWRIDEPPGDGADLVRADRLRLRQVVLNLLSNAVKYNRDCGTVGLSVSRREGGWVRIGVTDTGDGLEPEQIRSLFEGFNRLGRERGAIEGTGIGLAIARRLMLSMAGRIGVESTPGEGSRFHIDLPQAAALLSSPS